MSQFSQSRWRDGWRVFSIGRCLVVNLWTIKTWIFESRKQLLAPVVVEWAPLWQAWALLGSKNNCWFYGRRAGWQTKSVFLMLPATRVLEPAVIICAEERRRRQTNWLRYPKQGGIPVNFTKWSLRKIKAKNTQFPTHRPGTRWCWALAPPPPRRGWWRPCRRGQSGWRAGRSPSRGKRLDERKAILRWETIRNAVYRLTIFS